MARWSVRLVLSFVSFGVFLWLLEPPPRGWWKIKSTTRQKIVNEPNERRIIEVGRIPPLSLLQVPNQTDYKENKVKNNPKTENKPR